MSQEEFKKKRREEERKWNSTYLTLDLITESRHRGAARLRWPLNWRCWLSEDDVISGRDSWPTFCSDIHTVKIRRWINNRNTYYIAALSDSPPSLILNLFFFLSYFIVFYFQTKPRLQNSEIGEELLIMNLWVNSTPLIRNISKPM